MTGPNRQRGAKTPSNSSTPVPWTGTVPRVHWTRPAPQVPWTGTVPLAMEGSMAQGGGQSTNSNSSPQAMRTSIHAGEQQAAGDSSNAAGQNRNQRAPGNGWGREAASPPSSTRCATSRVPSAGERGRGTQNVLGSNSGSDSIADAFNQANAKTQAKQGTMIPLHELSVQSNTLNEVISMEPKDKSMRRTNFVTQSSTCMMGIDVKMNPGTQEGWETMLEAAKVIQQRCGGRDILWTAIPLQNEDADKATGANAFPVAQQDDKSATALWKRRTGAHTAGQAAPGVSTMTSNELMQEETGANVIGQAAPGCCKMTSNELMQSVTGANTARPSASWVNTSSANAALQRITGANPAGHTDSS